MLKEIKQAIKSLHRNLLRSMLTTLGIVVGISAVIAMLEIGNGSSTAIKSEISSMGAHVLVVIPSTITTGGVTQGSGSGMTLTPDDADIALAQSPAVRSAAPIVRARAQLVYRNLNWVPSKIEGTTPSYLDVREWAIDEGEAFSDMDVTNGAKVCLIGRTVVDELFSGTSPIGKEIRVMNASLKVIGVLSEKGANMMGEDQDDVLLAPWTTIKYRVAGVKLEEMNQSISSTGGQGASDGLSGLYPSGSTELYPKKLASQKTNSPLLVRFSNVDAIMMAAKSAESIPEAIHQVSQVLRDRHEIGADEEDDFNIVDLTEVTNMLSSTTTLMTNLLLSIALISLVVGGVGIMNIMLVSVTERTREIGLRMAIGARASDILRQFLVEAIVLCLIGAIIGIIFGRLTSLLVQFFLRWPVESSPTAIIMAVMVAASVGVLFGFYPAWKGSRLDPIEALRYE